MARILCRCFPWAALTVLLLMTPACQTALEPVTGRKQFILTSFEAEHRAGEQAWETLLEKQKLSESEPKRRAVERVGRALASTVHAPRFEWEFRTFASEKANAFCLPGGKIGVYGGLFDYVENDAQLATVVAHEIAHAVARHGGERMTRAMMLEIGQMGVAYAIKDKSDLARERWLAAYAGISTVGFVLPYSRMQEYAADEIGLMYMARAGYSPDAAVAFWKRFSKAEGGANSPLSEFLSTHPVGEKRIERLRSLLPRARKEYAKVLHQRGNGRKYAF